MRLKVIRYTLYKDYYKLIIICGTDKHEQCAFIRKLSVSGFEVKQQYEAKVFDPNLRNRKLRLPLKSLIGKLNLTIENTTYLIYDAASHLLIRVMIS